MSAWLKAVRPALKLMNVFTTATDASEMAVAAGMPSSRTRPDDWRVKRPEPVAARPPLIGALVLAILPLLNRANVLSPMQLEGSRTIGNALDSVKNDLSGSVISRVSTQRRSMAER